MSHLSKIKKLILSHKIWSIIVLLIVVFIGYRYYQSKANASNVTRYVVAAAAKGTIVSTVTGTGQVAASSQINLVPKASGNIVYLGVKVGQPISAGTLIAQIDSRSAELDLQNAQISLNKLTEPPDQATLLQSQNAVISAQDSKIQAENNLSKSYDDSFSNISNTFLDVPNIIIGLDGLFNDWRSSPYFEDNKMPNVTAQDYRNTALRSFSSAKDAYNKNLADYQKINRQSASSSIEDLVEETYNTTQLISRAVKDANTAVSYVIQQTDTSGRTSAMTTDTSNIASWTSKISGHLSDLASIRNTISTARDTIASSDRTTSQAQATLDKLKQGADANDIAAQKLSIEQKQLAYENYFVRAPFDGTMGTLNVNQGDPASSGTGIGTFITNKKIATISLNEVDAAKIKVGDRATLTFDAVPNLSISGQVAEVDLVGTVSQGVVSYNVQIGFDTQDSRIRSGMTVDAAVQTEVAQDILTVPSSAIKTQGTANYVQLVDKNTAVTNNQGAALTLTPTMQAVQTGISDDQNTEIVSGLSEGDKIITRTIAPSSSSAQTSSQAPSLFGAGGRVGGGAFRGATGGRGN